MRKGVLEERLKTYVNDDKFLYSLYFTKKCNGPLSQESVDSLLKIESGITTAMLPPPIDITLIMAHISTV